jgi:hypothetical protein
MEPIQMQGIEKERTSSGKDVSCFTAKPKLDFDQYSHLLTAEV